VTDVHDFLHNRYFAISRYRVPGLGRVDLSLAPLPVGVRPGSRAEKLEQAVQEAEASFQLRVQDARGRFFPIVDIELTDHVNLDQAQLRFSPFHAGRGLDPVGFVHGLRWAAYAASRLGERVREAVVPGKKALTAAR
jgi:hypothetical protein